MTEITNTLIKLGGGSDLNCNIIKRYPWENRKDVLKFRLELIKAELSENSILSMNFTVSKVFLNGNRKLGEAFENIFYSWDVQEDIREKIFEKYKLDVFGIEYIEKINFKFL